MPLNVLRCATDSVMWDGRKGIAVQVEHKREQLEGIPSCTTWQCQGIW